MNPVIGEGTQIALDMYRCLETVIQDPIQIETILKECMDRFSVKALHFYLDEDPDEGSLIFTVPVKGGHVILRVCEEFGYAGLDIMNMNGDFIPEELGIAIRKEMGPDQLKMTVIKRGDFGNIEDMKPRRQKMVKPMRRAKNAGVKLKNFMLKK